MPLHDVMCALVQLLQLQGSQGGGEAHACALAPPSKPGCSRQLLRRKKGFWVRSATQSRMHDTCC